MLGHTNSECRSSGCKVCNKSHNSLLHFDKINNVSHSNDSDCINVPQMFNNGNIVTHSNTNLDLLTNTNALSISQFIVKITVIKMIALFYYQRQWYISWIIKINL